MTLVENEITQGNLERARNNEVLQSLSEVEQKHTPTRPEVFVEMFKESAVPIEQIYLSNPDDEFSLRLRRVGSGDDAEYTATLKDRGECVDGALKRTEVTTEISAEAYTRYQSMELPRVSKLRAEALPGVTIDLYEGGPDPVVVEIEHPDAEVRDYLEKVLEEMTGETLVNRSEDTSLTTESIAHQSSNVERTKTPESLDVFVDRVFAEAVAHYVSGKDHVVITLKGMSGSGKSTVTRLLEERFVELYGEQMKPNVISTDDYHFGKKKLEEEHGAPYVEWDAAKTYNTAELAEDLARLANGEPVAKRHFSFETEEPELEAEFFPRSPFVIVEGLYAGSRDLSGVRDAHFELPTSIATSVGRDVRRLVIDDRANRAFPTPGSRLRHQIEVALPTYLDQEQPERKSFSASVRPLAERAFMLADVNR